MRNIGIQTARLAGLIVLLLLLSAVAADPAVLALDSDPVQGAMVVVRVSPGSRLWQDGGEVRVSAGGVAVLGFGRDAPSKSRIRVLTTEGADSTHVIEVRKRKYQIQRIDGLPPSKVTPRKPEVLARIRKEAAQVRAARTRDDDRQDFLRGFQWPVLGRISGVYGSQRILNGEPKRPHMGVDIAAPKGTAVRAPAAGVVTLAHPDMFFTGATLLLDHGHGVSTSYSHLDKLLVEVGERVAPGQPIAEVGASGRATGPHLHWGMNLFDKRLDPALVVGPMPSGQARTGG